MRIDDGDIGFVLERSAEDFQALSGARLFVSGGTGFVGKWMLETALAANRLLKAGLSIVVLTRDPNTFRDKFPALANDPAIELLTGDVLGFDSGDARFDAIIHAATPASAAFNETQPELMFRTIVEGTRNVLRVAERSGPISLLVTSSGAVYGPQPVGVSRIGEDFRGGPDPLDPRSAYHEGKRSSELLAAIAQSRGVRVKIARLFAFVGPYLPIDRHFAVGNFIRDALSGGPIHIGGDGTAERSYLYAADMAVWLWRILARATPCRAYNVGSEDAYTIAEIARAVTDASGQNLNTIIAKVADPARTPDRYIPSTERARQELDLRTWTPFASALRQTLDWHRRYSTC